MTERITENFFMAPSFSEWLINLVFIVE